MYKIRDSFFDSVRGIAIIAVVATHCIYVAGVPDSPGFIYYRQLLNFCVPVFIFMSGCWASKEEILSLSGYKAFLRRKLFRICTPYLFWSFLFITASSLKENSFSISEAAFKIFTGGAMMGYYFIIAILQLYVLTPLLQYLNRKMGWYGALFVSVFQLIAISALYLSRLFQVIPHLPMALLFYSWILYYNLGLYLGPRLNELRVSSRLRIAVLCAIPVCLLISFLEASIMLSNQGERVFVAFPAKFSTMMYATAVILGFVYWREYLNGLPKILAVVGRYSFGIYLIHMILLGLCVRLFQDIDIISGFVPVYYLVLTSATVGLCMVVILSARKFLPEWVCVKVLGF